MLSLLFLFLTIIFSYAFSESFIYLRAVQAVTSSPVRPTELYMLSAQNSTGINIFLFTKKKII